MGCPTSRAIAAYAGGTCPVVPVRPSDSTIPVKTEWRGEVVAIGSTLRDQYCNYQLRAVGGTSSQPGAPPQVDLDSWTQLQEGLKSYLQPLKQPNSLDPGPQLSCPVIVPMGKRARSSNQRFSADLPHARRNLGIAPTFPPEDTRVRVAVVDTAVKPYNCVGDCAEESAHGRAIGRYISSLLCQNPDNCQVVRNYLGLPLKSPNLRPDFVTGGSLGSFESLAAGIERALNDWLAAPEPRLIINLSVGWHPLHHGVEPSQLGAWKPSQNAPPEQFLIGPRQVRSAIERARCAGALILAAAGNSDGEDRAGAVYPASWETVPALTQKDCEERFKPLNIVAGSEPEPLVFAITAVDYLGSPLPNTRKGLYRKIGGIAPRAALGLAISSPEAGGGFTPEYSGTSMATASVSALAAAEWAKTPSKHAGELMVSLPALPTTDCARKDEDPVTLCLRRGEGCDPNFSPLATYRVLGARGACISSASSPPPPPASLSAKHCRAGKEHFQCGADKPVVPRLARPWVYPLPEIPICPDCTLFVNKYKFVVNLTSLTTTRAKQVRFYSRGSPLQPVATFSFGDAGAAGTIFSGEIPRDTKDIGAGPTLAVIVGEDELRPEDLAARSGGDVAESGTVALDSEQLISTIFATLP